MLWRRKLLILASALAGLLIGYGYLQQQPTVFRSSAQVLVIKGQSSVAVADLFDADAYVAAQAKLIKSPLIVQRALATEDLPLKWASEADPATSIINALTADVDRNLLTLSFSGPDPVACRQILSAVIRSYETFLNDTLHSSSEKTFQHITHKADQFQQRLRDQTLRLQQLQQQLPLDGSGPDGGKLQQQRLAAIESKRLELQIRRAEIEARLILADTTEPDSSTPEEEIEDGSLSGGSEKLNQQLLILQMEETSLLARFGEDHPEVLRVRRQMDLTRAAFDRTALQAATVARSRGLDAGDQPFPTEAKLLRQELAHLEQADRAMVQLLQRERTRTRAMTDAELEAKKLQAEIARNEKVHNSLMDQLQRYDVGKELGGYTTSVISPAATGIPVKSDAVRTLLAATVLGIVIGVALAYWSELADKSFHSPDEIRSRLGVPVIGEVPHHPQRETGNAVTPLLLQTDAAQSPPAEAYRAIRTALLFGDFGGPRKVVQVSGSHRGDGSSTVAANLAVAFAQVGKKTLLIDANLRDSRLHEFFHVNPAAGLTDVLGGSLRWEAAVRSTSVENLDLICCGPAAENPGELLSSPRLAAMLSSLRAHYDQVLIDTSGLLEVSDPCVVAHHVDGLMLILRIQNRDRYLAGRACEVLGPLAGTLLGVVVTNPDGHRRPWASPPLAARRLVRDFGNPVIRDDSSHALHAGTSLDPRPAGAPQAGSVGSPVASAERPEQIEAATSGAAAAERADELESLLHEMRADLQQVLRRTPAPVSPESAASLDSRST